MPVMPFGLDGHALSASGWADHPDHWCTGVSGLNPEQASTSDLKESACCLQSFFGQPVRRGGSVVSFLAGPDRAEADLVVANDSRIRRPLSEWAAAEHHVVAGGGVTAMNARWKSFFPARAAMPCSFTEGQPKDLVHASQTLAKVSKFMDNLTSVGGWDYTSQLLSDSKVVETHKADYMLLQRQASATLDGLERAKGMLKNAIAQTPKQQEEEAKTQGTDQE